MNSKMIIIILVALGIFAFMGLNQPGEQAGTNATDIELQGPGIRVANSTTAVGEGSAEFRQAISYTAVLQNTETIPVYIESAEILLIPDIKARVSSGEMLNEIAEEIPAGGTIEISGKIEFNSEALSKKDIESMGKLVTGFRINSYRIAMVP